MFLEGVLALWGTFSSSFTASPVDRVMAGRIVKSCSVRRKGQLKSSGVDYWLERWERLAQGLEPPGNASCWASFCATSSTTKSC